ncbi:hypothetical protein PG985_014035 [Apiospora marii]|uniref:uncharacterized protein n=1 Tax=Apiospora marii TaxID=335849 RepID=UPI0031308CB4
MATTAMLPLFPQGRCGRPSDYVGEVSGPRLSTSKGSEVTDSPRTAGVNITHAQPLLPHSFLFGHLPIFAKFSQSHPPDINIDTFHTWLVENLETYFPGHEFPPPVVYLDIWPASEPLAMVTDPVAVSQFTIAKSEPKVDIVTTFFGPLTSGLDILTNEDCLWKTWHSRFNPGFSQRNLTTLVPEIVEEVSVFVERLKQGASRGEDGWGPVFQLQERAIDLTFDVIGRAALDMRLQSQSEKSDKDLRSILVDQIRLMDMFQNVGQGRLIGRWPWHDRAIACNNKAMRDILYPQIQRKLLSDSKASLLKATVLDLALKHVDADGAAAGTTKEEPTKEFIEQLISNLKVFLLAGHDTTAATMCFMTKLLQDHPDCLDKLRAEHDTVLGPDPAQAAPVLIASPHLLHSLQYTLGVIKETLRLYPLAATVRKSYLGYHLTGADSTVQYPMEGFGLWASAPLIQRHPKYWPRPNDFLPERWTVAEGDPLYPSTPNTWLPFSQGPRNCIGMELASVELRLVLVLTARTLEIGEAWREWDVLRGDQATPSHTVDGQRLYRVGTGLVHPKDGMPVHVRLRK